MLGNLPTTINVGGRPYDIRADFRNVLNIFSAFNDPDLNDREKAYICLCRLYADFKSMPEKDIREALEKALKFLECEAIHEDKPSPRTVNWVKDEQLIFPAVNCVAGMEVRALPFLHWWTFFGYFQSIDHDSLCGYVMTIRQKRARGKKLEKHEREFYSSNTALCRLDAGEVKVNAVKNTLEEMYKSLLEEGDA